MKLTHELVKTDLEPKDRQNFRSCLKLSNENILIDLDDINSSQATRVYLRLLRSIVIAYVEQDTPIVERVYPSWPAVFLCRIWQTRLQLPDEKDIPRHLSDKRKDDLFITTPAHFSIDINAHSLLSICLIVCDGQLPRTALAIWNYNTVLNHASLSFDLRDQCQGLSPQQ